MELGHLEDIKESGGMKLDILPAWVIEMQIEILANHPQLVKLLQEGLKGDNFEPETWYGLIAAYCGIALDGAYSQQYLAENLTKQLIAKRSIVKVVSTDIDGPNIVSVSKELLQ